MSEILLWVWETYDVTAAILQAECLPLIEITISVVEQSTQKVGERGGGGGEPIDLKNYKQMIDFGDFRFPYRLERVYFRNV